MKKIVLLCTIICIFLNANYVFAATTVEVDGESSTGNKIEALDNAKLKAVRRVLSKMTAANDDPNSVFQKILSRYKEFAAEPKVFEKYTSDKTLHLMSSVEVDSERLLQAVNSEITSERIQNDDQRIVFLVRIKGLPSALFKQNWNKLLILYQDTFEQRGFALANNVDELQSEFEKHNGENFDNFYRQLVESIKTDYPEITVALIGEIALSREQEIDSGRLIRSDIHISAVDTLNDKLIVKFNDVCKLKVSNTSEVENVSSDFFNSMTAGSNGGNNFIDVILRKSVLNSSAFLSDKIVNYWKNL